MAYWALQNMRMQGCLSEQPAMLGGCTKMVRPMPLPVLPCSDGRLRRLFFPRVPIHYLSMPKHSARLQRSSAVVAIQAPERILERERKGLEYNGKPPNKVLTNGRVAESSESAAAVVLPVHVEWYNKNKELWREADSKEELLQVIEAETEKFVVVDFYTGWCSSCKAAYPALCKVAGNPDFNKNFKFVKADIQVRDIALYIRTLGIKGIPAIVVFAPGGKKLAHFGASFRKMNMVKANLTVMNANRGEDFVTNSEGFVFPKPESV